MLPVVRWNDRAAPGASRAGLKRVLNAADAAWIVAGSMIGAGIFYVPGQVTALLPGLTRPLLAWLAGGLLALAGALVYAELGTRLPQAGGDYQYLRAAFGGPWAFLSGWAAFMATFSAAAALMAIVAAEHLGAAVAVAGLPALEPHRLVAPTIVLLLTAVNARGARFSGRTTAVLKLLPLVGLAALFGYGLSQGAAGLAAPWPEPRWRGSVELVAFGSAMLPVFFTYSGWNAAAYLAGELRDPQRDLLRGLVAGTLGVTVVYFALNLVVLLAVPPEELAGSTAAAAQAARALLGPRAESWLALCVAVAVLGAANVTLMAGARIYWAMARDGLLPKAFERTNRAGVPAAALGYSGLWTALLALFGEVGVLLEWSTLAILLLSSMTVLALFVLRRADPAGGTFRCPCYPILPGAYLAASLAIAMASAWQQPLRSACGLALLALGIPVWAWIRRRQTLA
jgi:APA family basic amino acid/polyamine antiporter